MLALGALFAWWRFGNPTDLGYESVSQDYPLLSGLTGQIWSPGKGLLWYAPVVVLSIAGAVVMVRRRTPEVVLLVTVALANTLFYARVPFWSGDNSWGPRYTLIILPALVPLAIGVLRWSWGLRAIQVAGVVGVVFVGLPGSLVSFNTLYIQATRELGAGAETQAVRYDLDWQPIVNHLRMLPDAVQDAVGVEREGEVQRGDYTGDPAGDYSFYGAEPRLDVWWAWVGPTRASGLSWVFLVPSVACLAAAAVLEVRGRRSRTAGRKAPPVVSGSAPARC
jgi:hypothetical protein